MRITKNLILVTLSFVLLSAFSLRARESGDATKEFGGITDRIKAMMGSVAPEEIYGKSKEMLVPFIEKYPDSREAGQARLLLAQLGMQLGEDEEAIGYMRDFLSSKYADENPAVNNQVKYMMGLSYINLERFEEARKVLGEITRGGGNIDQRLKGSAQMQLGRIETLKKLRTGMPAIEFETERFGGGRLSLRDFRGKVVLLDFWATWCAPCRTEMPNVKKLYSEYHGKGFEIIGISLDREREKLESYLKSNGITWPQVFDGNGWNNKIGKLYAVASIPSTYLLDREGRIRYKNLRGNELRKAVEKLIGEGK